VDVFADGGGGGVKAKTVEQVLPVLSEAIRLVRFDAGMSEKDFAVRVFSTRRAVRQMEKGLSPNLWTLLKIGEIAKPGPAKDAIISELRVRISACPLLKVVA
jgi:hypothetical protein